MKPSLLFIGPVGTLSGYGAHARDIVRSIIELDMYSVSIIDVRWGDTPRNFLQKRIPEHKLILDRIVSQVNAQPDVLVHLTVPNEFQPIAKYNIGITAGIETTLASQKWLEGLNRMDLIIVPSQHSAKVFQSSSWKNIDQNTNQIVSEVKLVKPIEVLFEGVDTDIYKKIKQIDISENIASRFEEIKEDFNFLYVGHWLRGDLGQDRKDTGMLVRTFVEAFKGQKKKPGLILKTSAATTSILDREEIVNKIYAILKGVSHSDLPNIYLLHGEFTDSEMNEIYNHGKVKAMVTFTKGEGFGRPLLEFSVTGKPVIAPAYSGHLDFLPGDKSVLLPGALTDVHKSSVWKDVILAESKWFTVNYNYAIAVIRRMFHEYDTFTARSEELAKKNSSEFTLEGMKHKLKEILETYVPKMAVEVPLNLPELKLAGSSDKKMKLELPKLKPLSSKQEKSADESK